ASMDDMDDWKPGCAMILSSENHPPKQMQQRRGHNAVVWISVDELLEKVMLKLYKRWDAGALARLRPWLDEERLRLGTTLRSLASAHITQSEDEIVLFLDRLAGQEPIVAMAGEELAPLADVKQSLLRARRPGM